MRLIGDVNDKAPAEPGDLRIVRRAGEGFEEFLIEQATERAWGMRWLGLRWAPLGCSEFPDLTSARRRAELKIREHDEAIAAWAKSLQIEAATPMPCSWDGSLPEPTSGWPKLSSVTGSALWLRPEDLEWRFDGKPTTLSATLEGSPSESGEGMAPVTWGPPQFLASIRNQRARLLAAGSDPANLRLEISRDVFEMIDADGRHLTKDAGKSRLPFLGMPWALTSEHRYAVVDDITKP